MGARGPTSNRSAVISFKEGVPAAPDYLTKGAKLEYARIIDLYPSLQQVDFGVVLTYVRAFDDCATLSKILSKEGHVIKGARGGTILNPAIRALESAEGRMLAAAARLGFSPADRQRIPNKQAANTNPFASFVGEQANNEDSHRDEE